MKKTALKILSIIGAIFCAVFCLFSSTFATFPVSAADAPTDYTKTKIMDDLSDVEMLLYPKNPLGVPKVIRFQEYCYSEKGFYSMYYGLFVYIYNPTEVPLKTERNFNKINIATAYDEDGQPTSYDNVRLTYCDSVSNRIYKFYVSDSDSILKTAKAYAKEHGRRRYDIAGVQLTHTDGTFTDSQTKDRAYGYTYYFTGYAATCDINNPEAKSTLKCSAEKLETIKLDVHQTNYRTGDYKEGFVCDELNTVYFSVPDDYFEEYGNLQKIKAEWYEYKTKPIFVTSDSDGYHYLYDYIGKNIHGLDGFKWRVDWHRKNDGVWYRHYDNVTAEESEALPGVTIYNDLYWLFEREGAKSNADYKVSKEEMLEYAIWYSEKVATAAEKIVGANGEYSVKLFEDSIDTDRLHLVQEYNKNATNGYVCQEIDAGDAGSLTVQKDQGFWDKLWNGVKYEEKGYDPIIVLDSSDNLASMDAAQFARTYLVNAEEAKDILKYCKTEIKNNGKVVLFRFAVTDYYASTACFEYIGNPLASPDDGYVAQETVFLNFDVISLTFRGAEEKDVVIGCVADPIDIINGLDAPPDLDGEEDKWALLVGLLLGFAILVVILIVIGVYFPTFGPMALNGSVKIITGIGAGFRKIGQAFKDVFASGKGNKGDKKGGKK